MISRLPRFLAAFTALFLWASFPGCAFEPVKPQAPAAPAAHGAPASSTNKPPALTTEGVDFLNAGDRVKVVFSDTPIAIAPLEMQIPDGGELTLHLGYKFMFKGKRRDVLEQEIRDFYLDKQLYKIVNVTIEVPARPISVGGEVRSPGTYPHSGQMTVLKAIDMAGGFTEFAKKTKVTIIRGGKTFTVDCKKALDDPEKYDKPIFPGDKVNVRRSYF